MSIRRYAATFVAVAVLVPTALGASPQRKQAGGSEKTTPQAELKKGEKPRLFVSSGAGTSERWTEDITRQTLEESLVKAGRFEIIAGSQRDNILREQGFTNSDLVDPSQRAKVGQMLAARYLVSGTCQSVTKAEKKSGTGGIGGAIGGGFGRMVDKGSESKTEKITAQIQIQMVDLESGKILISETYTETSTEKSSGFESKSTDNPQEAAYRQLVATATSKFIDQINAQVPIETLVALVDGGTVALAAGSGAGVSPGMKFEIYSEGEPIKNPATGEVLSYKTTKYAVVRIDKVEEKLAWASIVRTFADNGAQDPTPNPTRIEASMSARSMPGREAGPAVPDDSGKGGKKKKDKDNN